MPQVLAYACDDATTRFHKTTIDLREPGPGEIYFDVKYAGICHSDIHTARGEWGPVAYPLVPGHEFVGVVARVGEDATRFAVGDRVGVGCMVGSCGQCEMCGAGYEQWCTGTPGTLWTYRADAEGNPTTGGYAQGFTVSEDFACRIPDQIPFDAAAPLLCAGITMYSPLRRYGAGPGTRGAGSREASRIDWDHPDSWDAERAMRAILDLCAVGRTEVPVYSIPDNAVVGRAGLDIGRAHAFVAEGIFAAELIDRCRAEGVLAAALVLRRPRPATWWFRLRRDLAEHRKPPAVLLRRGLRLAREEPGRIRAWMAQGCRAVSRRQCEAAIAEHIGSSAVPGNRADGVM